jgi:hypothetical protein
MSEKPRVHLILTDPDERPRCKHCGHIPAVIPATDYIATEAQYTKEMADELGAVLCHEAQNKDQDPA